MIICYKLTIINLIFIHYDIYALLTVTEWHVKNFNLKLINIMLTKYV